MDAARGGRRRVAHHCVESGFPAFARSLRLGIGARLGPGDSLFRLRGHRQGAVSQIVRDPVCGSGAARPANSSGYGEFRGESGEPGVSPMTQENLALLYQGLLTGIVRIRSGKQPLANAEMFRRRTKEALGEVTREAIKRGYAAEHTMETDFALVALLDEVILSSHDPSREAWAQRPLQEELFGLTTA